MSKHPQLETAAHDQDVPKHIQQSCLALLREFRDINYIVVAAIDFGSTYSGYAFSTRFNYKTRPLEVSSAVWNAGSGTMQSQKTATCILFDPDQSFHSFGFEAENYYADLVENEKHEKWYFFHRFKMQLYSKEVNNQVGHFSISSGRKDTSSTESVHSLHQVLEKADVRLCDKQGLEVNRPDIRWVVTVPAIWSDDAKQFMRKAAEKAEIPGPQLFLALEAEAAALYCKHLPADCMIVRPEDHITAFSPSTKYMILDVGGGTVDITVHQVQNDLTLKEVYMATGGNWGGLEVDKAFESLMNEIFEEEVYKTFKLNHPSDMLELLRSFEVKKRKIKGNDVGKKITFDLPLSLITTYESIHPTKNISSETKEKEKIMDDVTWHGTKMRISNKLAVSLFEKSLTSTKEHLKRLFNLPEVQDISVIMMVGGYSECPLLQDMVKETIPNRKLIVPNEAGLAILKGAVINGHEPDTITERICRHSYGVKTCVEFVESIHPPEFCFFAEAGLCCSNVFSTHLKKHEHIALFVAGTSTRYTVVFRDQTELALPVYVSTEENTKFVTDASCRLLGTMMVDMSNTSRGLDRGVDLVMTLGGAELQVEATDIYTNEKRFAYFDFLGTPSDAELDRIVQ